MSWKIKTSVKTPIWHHYIPTRTLPVWEKKKDLVKAWIIGLCYNSYQDLAPWESLTLQCIKEKKWHFYVLPISFALCEDLLHETTMSQHQRAAKSCHLAEIPTANVNILKFLLRDKEWRLKMISSVPGIIFWIQRYIYKGSSNLQVISWLSWGRNYQKNNDSALLIRGASALYFCQRVVFSSMTQFH